MVRTAAVLWRAVWSSLYWTFGCASTPPLFAVAVVLWALTAPFDRRRVLLHRYTCLWAAVYTWVNPAWKVEVRGRERIAAGATYVMVANHASTLDILVLFRLFVHFKWVSKAENFHLWFIGWNMALNGYIPLRRGDRASVARMMRDAEASLRGGSSVMMFPEGTRSPDGRLRQFKPGAFALAARAGVPVVPIAIEGTARALPKRGFILGGAQRILVRVLEPIEPCAEQDAAPMDVAQMAQDRIADALGGPSEQKATARC